MLGRQVGKEGLNTVTKNDLKARKKVQDSRSSLKSERHKRKKAAKT